MLDDTEKEKRFREFVASIMFWAACESDHLIWSGPTRASYKEAQGDATRHDKATHGGESTAVVLEA